MSKSRHPTTPQFVDELLAGTYDDDRTFRDLPAAPPPPYPRGSRPELATEKVARPLEWRVAPDDDREDEDELDVHSFADGTYDGPSQWMREPAPRPSTPAPRPSEPMPRPSTRMTARGTQPPPPRVATQMPAMATPSPRAATRIGRAIAAPTTAARPTAKPTRSAGESIARLLYFASGALIAGAVALYGGRMWHAALKDHPAAPAAQPAPQPAAAAALLVPDGRLELTADRRNVTRLTGDAPRWSAPQPAALDSIALTGPLVIGQTADAIAAIDLDSGRTRFTWTPPADETWATQAPVALDSCLLTTTAHGKKTLLRCLDLSSGTVKWTTALTNAHDCTQPPLALPGALMMQCAGWTAIIDERNGAVDIEAGAAGLVSDKPPLLLRTRNHLAIDSWSPPRRRFVAGQSFGAIAPASSAVLYKDRLVVRATEASDDLAFIASATERTPISAPVYRLADSAPLTRNCGGETSPRFQLLELAPRIGASFDPAAVADRALALLDVDRANLAWTSRKGAIHRAEPLCRANHYFVPLEIIDHNGAPESLLWIFDAETGKTTSVLALDDPEATFAQLTTDQVDDQRIVIASPHGALTIAWAKPTRGVHDARHDLEAALGVLP